MEERKAPSFSRTYVPNRYTIYLCTDDREHFRGYESSLGEELAEHVLRHARKEGYLLVGSPQVGFKSDPDLKRGQFGILAEMAEGQEPGSRESAGGDISPDDSGFSWEPSGAEGSPAGAAAAGVASGLPLAPAGQELAAAAARGAVESAGRVPFFPTKDERIPLKAEPPRSLEDRPRAAGSETESIPVGVAAAMGLARQTLVLHHDGRRYEFEKGRVVLGRGRQVDYQLDDPNVSRRHAVIYWENGRLFLKDLGSTNGTLLNGRPVSAGPLSRGDVITVGGSEIRVETG
jgi:hypothetical protein